jgi:hypothetical protein
MNLRELAAPGVNAIWKNRKPILLIQVAFLIFVILFYKIPAFAKLPENMDTLKQRWGLVYTLGSMWFVSILIPEIAKVVTGQRDNRLSWRDILYLMAFYGIMGLALDLFYTTIASIVGSDRSVGTLVKKVLLDQLGFSVFFSMPFSAVTFLFRDKDFSISETGKALRQGEFVRRYLPMLITCWMYFGPMAIAIYSLPTELNYPTSMAAQAAWGIIIVAVGTQKKP